MAEANDKLLDIKDLKVHFITDAGIVKAVDQNEFFVRRGEVVTIVGESGSGKSVTGLALMRLLNENKKTSISGRLSFTNQDLLQLNEKEMRKVRGNRISMIFQHPSQALDPSFTIGFQIIEAIRTHKKISKKEARDKARYLLELFGLTPADKYLHLYPHSLSEGICQRVMIAMALSCEPALLIADEPTTNLDSMAQAEILKLLKEMQHKLGISILLITHDFQTVEKMSDRVIVMYAGKIVEQGTVKEILEDPKHPYTIGLIHSVPKVGLKLDRLYQIEGQPANLLEIGQGCSFVSRCVYRKPQCYEPLKDHYFNDQKMVRCIYKGELPVLEEKA